MVFFFQDFIWEIFSIYLIPNKGASVEISSKWNEFKQHFLLSVRKHKSKEKKIPSTLIPIPHDSG